MNETPPNVVGVVPDKRAVIGEVVFASLPNPTAQELAPVTSHNGRSAVDKGIHQLLALEG